MKALTTLLAISISALAGTGCSGETGEGPEPGTGIIPAELLNVEGQGEDAFDKALAGDFPAVRAVAVTIDTNWRVFRPRAVTDGAASADLAAMDSAVAALTSTAATSTDPIVVARATNAISAPMDDLFALYSPPVPPAMLTLDYLGRELVLDGMEADLPAAANDLATVDATWAGVRSAVVDAGGTAEAANYDASISRLRGATAGTAIVAEANAGLEIVDAIEGLFAP